ncbi:hypothetical protein VTJ83DRAFT_3624 [Remersonia thermophila]|uniref:Domain of unknown function at the cortex 1 domain-containing protein n=1 Tax=Remersonia thermophila TaxID=72144 RepID=A0ABR4DEH8_9PEZI
MATTTAHQHQPKYLLRVTAGPGYDISTHVEVPVNLPTFPADAASRTSSPSFSPSSSPSDSSSSVSSSSFSETSELSSDNERDEPGREEEGEGTVKRQSKKNNGRAGRNAESGRGEETEEGTVYIKSRHCEAHVGVRVHNFYGIPRDAPTTSPYFQTEPHKAKGDQYSIAVRFRLFDGDGPAEVDGGGRRRTDVGDPDPAVYSDEDGENKNDAAESRSSSSSSSSRSRSASPSPGRPGLRPGVPATDLQFGNDFDHPIRDRLPPGFNTAMNIVKWWIDPGLDGDAYADEPYLYGPALSSFNAVHVGRGEHDPRKGGLWVEEGGDEEGSAWRREIGVPEDGKQRMKWALGRGNKEKWVWEYGRWYAVDFFNAYLDFKDFALRLPGFNLPIMGYWDGQGLRYVLRNRVTGQVYLVVLFTLHLAEEVEA